MRFVASPNDKRPALTCWVVDGSCLEGGGNNSNNKNKRPRIIHRHGGQSRWNDLGSNQNGEDASIFPVSNFGCIFTLEEFKI